jgi:excinuclease ABC subunit A
VEQFSEPRQLAETLGALNQVGLGYLQLGQSATELSGGEAQRLKLASAIQRGAAGRKAGLVVLDEPVSGLHPSDIQRVVDALDVLLDSGNTVVVAEHDIPVAASADWVIDLGPGAGPDGGAVIAEGTPDAVATANTPTAGFFRRYAAGLPLLEVRDGERC